METSLPVGDRAYTGAYDCTVKIVNDEGLLGIIVILTILFILFFNFNFIYLLC